MSLEQDLKNIETAEKNLHKLIDDEVSLEEEIKEVSNVVATQLENKPMALMCIQNREFIVMATTYNNLNRKSMQIVAREKQIIETSKSKILKADFVIDENYTKRENLVTGIKALLGHMTGLIKPESL